VRADHRDGRRGLRSLDAASPTGVNRHPRSTR
jgi:hypothetical protein